MGSLIQSSGPGEINMITSALCISLLTSYCLSQPGYEDWMEDRCCPLKAVESASDESKNEMFALVEQVPWSQVEVENCTSNCAYVKMKDLKMVMEEMMNMTNMDMDMDMDMNKTTAAPTRMEESAENKDKEMMYMLFGKEKMMKMMMKMKINRLQKYCFTPTDKDTQSMCAAPDMDMNVIGMIYDMANKEDEDYNDDDEEKPEKPEKPDEEENSEKPDEEEKPEKPD